VYSRGCREFGFPNFIDFSCQEIEMDDKARTNLSKFLSLVLRHRPGMIGIQLDRYGWTAVDTLLSQCQAHGRGMSRPMLDEIVQTSPKQRFAMSDDGLRIRANQGHSVDVELGLEIAVPPDVLFHGTAADRFQSIRSRGLRRMKRHHVHLSLDIVTARTVGERRGKAVVLRVLAGMMHRDGYSFYLSANGVWLTESVPPRYIDLQEA
jgi:putative RNA 2'-phosphotransferase